jgi:hypothetical protein
VQKAQAAVFNGEEVQLRMTMAPEVVITLRVAVFSASGRNAMEIGAAMKDFLSRFRFFGWRERDFKRFDSSNQRLHLAVKVTCWQGCGAEFIAWLQECYNTTKGRAVVSKESSFGRRFVAKWTVPETVSSGHNDTSSGNTQNDAMATVQAALAEGYHSASFLVGDDALTGLAVALADDGGGWSDDPNHDDPDYDEVVTRLDAVEARLGLIPESRMFHDMCYATFASGRFYPTREGGWVFGPLIGRLLGRLFWSKTAINETERKRWHKTIGMGLWPVCHGIPVLRKFLQWSYNLTEVVMPREEALQHFEHEFEMYRGLEVRFDEGMMFRYVALVYSVSVVELQDVEKYLSSHDCTRRVLLRHPVLDKLVAHDCADLLDRPVGAGKWDA